MKILYFHQHFTTPTIGGGTRSYEFARKLIEKGHKVTIVCGKTAELSLAETKNKYISRGVVDGIDVIQIQVPYSNSDGVVKRAWVFMKFALLGLKVSRKESYDLLFATSTPLTAGIPGIWMKVFSPKKAKFVFEVRDLWPELPKALGLKNPILLWGMSLLEKMSYNKADGCIGLSPGICEGIKKRCVDQTKPLVMIPNGCDLSLFNPNKKSKITLDGIEEGNSIVVFTGAHGVANGLDSVLDLAGELKKREREDIKLVFIGNGKMKPYLINRAKEEKLNNCLFFPNMSKFELSNIVASADVGLMVLKNVPAFYYGTSPNKFFDYISSGLPIINNYPGWLADMINKHNCGVVVEPDDAVGFANSLIDMVDHKEISLTQSRNARSLAEKDFNRSDLSNQFVEFLESIYKG